MTTRDDILDAAQALILEHRSSPSIQKVAAAVGLTKQGVLHYFPTRAALDTAIARRALTRVDEEMQRAAESGSPTATYLRLSAPTAADRAAAYVSLGSLRDDRSGSAVLEEALEAVERWQRSMAEELGDPVLATLARLAGDGLFSQALLSGEDPEPDQIDQLVDRLVRGPGA